MRVLVVHLSDLHIAGDDSDILKRPEEIARAVLGLDGDIDACLLAVTGDIAFSGREEQYALAAELVQEIATHLTSLLPWRVGVTPRVEVAVCPGNHDCDFGSDERRKTRELLLDGLRRERSLAGNGHALRMCGEVQEAFEDFRQSISALKIDPVSGTIPPELCGQATLKVGTRSLRVLCINSAWSSTLKEQPGSLVYPVDGLALAPAADATLVLMHHPYNWFAPDTARILRQKLEHVASVVLTGHEHAPDSYSKTRRELGETVEFVEGGALSEQSSAATSEFNALLLDLEAGQQKLVRLSWTGRSYESQLRNGPIAQWTPFLGSQQRATQRLAFVAEHAQYLDDIGIQMRHRAKDVVTLRDVFVYPDVRKIDPRGDPTATVVVPGERLLKEVVDLRRIVISGESESGRTSLAKTLCRVLREKGKVPILLSPEAAPPPAGTALNWIVAAGMRQYGHASGDTLRDLSPAERVLVVDDFHRLQQDPEKKRRFLESLCSLAGIVVLTVHDLALDAEEIDEQRRLIPEALHFVNLRVMQMGHVKRDELVSKVLGLGGGLSDPDAFAARRHEIKKVLDTLIGSRFVPSYPLYVLSVLQAQEAGQPLDPQASTYGHFYELFIKLSLLRGKAGHSYEFQSALLSELAALYLADARRQLPRSRVLEAIARYLQERDLADGAEAVLTGLVEAQMLVMRGDDVSYRYPYIYYYFAATYLRDHLSDANVRAQVSAMCGHVHVEDFHGVLLFLAHLTRDSFVIGELLTAARRVFGDQEEARVAEDVAFLGRLNEELLEGGLTFEDRDAEQARREALSALDDEDEDQLAASWQDGASDKSPDGETTFLGQLTVALRTLQLVGQVLRNFAGSLKGDAKLEIAQECRAVGLRMMSGFFGLVAGHEREQIEGWAIMLRKRFPHLPDDELFRRAAGSIAGLSFLVCLGATLRIAEAIGAEQLDVTHRRMLADGAPPAHLLVDAAVKLGRSRQPSVAEVSDLARALQGNLVAGRVLQVLVLRHFHLFEVNTTTKQRLCSALGIAYKGMRGERPKQRLIGSEGASGAGPGHA